MSKNRSLVKPRRLMNAAEARKISESSYAAEPAEPPEHTILTELKTLLRSGDAFTLSIKTILGDEYKNVKVVDVDLRHIEVVVDRTTDSYLLFNADHIVEILVDLAGN